MASTGDILKDMITEAVGTEVERVVEERLLPVLDARPASATAIPAMVTVEQAATALQVSPGTVRKLVREKQLTGHWVGRLLRIRVDEFLNYLRRDQEGDANVIDLEQRARELLERA